MTQAIALEVLNHLWQSTLVLAGCWLLAWWLRRHCAEVRYWLWVVASVKFLVPSAALVTIGRQIGWPVATALPQPRTLAVLDSINHPVTADGVAWLPATAASALPEGMPGWLLAIVVVWLLGSVAQCSLWAIRWRRVAALVRRSPPLDDARHLARLRQAERLVGVRRPVRAVVSDGTLEPGVFGILRPVLIWPREIAERLTDSQADAVIAHELVHVRRGDNLVAAIQMASEVVFWFFPPVWWLEKRLVAERERACDETVLRLGHDPQRYAEGLLKICECYVEAPAVCVSGVTGSDLTQRVIAIVTRRAARPLGAVRRVLLVAAASVAVALPVVVGILQAPLLRAQVTSVADLPMFEVASVKQNTSVADDASFGVRGTYLSVVNNTLFNIVRNAYRVQADQILGGPDWIRTGSDRYDIAARAPEGTKPDQFLLMLEQLLADRFKLRLHKEARAVPMFALVMARADGRLGPKLMRAAFDCTALRAAQERGENPTPPPEADRPACGARGRPGQALIGGYPMSDVARTLSALVGGRPVVDRTGLTGIYDFELTWTPDQLPAAAAGAALPAIDPNGASLFTALQEQLGLRLEATTGPVEVIVIDSADRPMPD